MSVPARSEPDASRDALFGGRVVLLQPPRRAGYRVNVDAILLAAFAAPRRRARLVVDLGAGVGAISLSLLHHEAARRAVLVEASPDLSALAQRNLDENGWSDRAEVWNVDVARAPAIGADLVVCNPPYVAPGRGRPPAAHLASAKHGALGVFLDAGRRVVGRRARACFVYPAIEATTLLCELRARGLEPKRLRAVHGKPSDAARVVLVECAAGKRGGLAVLPPLIETDGRGVPTAELTALLSS